MMAIAMIAAFVVNLLLGLPLFLCLLLTALVGFLFVDPALFANTLPQRFFGGMDIFSLMAIPLFVLAGCRGQGPWSNSMRVSRPKPSGRLSNGQVRLTPRPRLRKRPAFSA